MPGITALGHVGLYCKNLEAQREFYSKFLGLTITDEDLEGRGLCFLSSDPEREHHEFALARMEPGQPEGKSLQQLSFIVDSLDTLRDYYHKIKEKSLRINRTVTHGISCSVYFYDPEENLLEVYYKTGYDVLQPLNQHIDLDKPNEELLAYAKSFEEIRGPSLGARAG